MSDPERNETTYVTKAGQVLYLNVPHGLVPPPMIDLHQPLAGPVTFFLAEAYRLPVPKQERV